MNERLLLEHLEDIVNNSNNDFAVMTFKCFTQIRNHLNLKHSVFHQDCYHRTTKSIVWCYDAYLNKIYCDLNNHRRKKKDCFVIFEVNHNYITMKNYYAHIHALIEVSSYSSIENIREFFNNNFSVYLQRSLKCKERLKTDVFVEKLNKEKHYIRYCSRLENDKFKYVKDDERVHIQTLTF